MYIKSFLVLCILLLPLNLPQRWLRWKVLLSITTCTQYQAMPVLAPWHLCCLTLKELIADFSSTLLTLIYHILLFYKLCTNDLQESRAGTLGNPVRNHWIPTLSLLMLLTPRDTEKLCKGEGKDKIWWLKKTKTTNTSKLFFLVSSLLFHKKGPPVYVPAFA